MWWAQRSLDRRALHRDNCVLQCWRLTAKQGIDVHIRDVNGNPVNGAWVELRNVGGVGAAVHRKQTDATGNVLFFTIVAQAWTVTAMKNWHLPHPQSQNTGVIGANAITVVNLLLTELKYELAVDADRDGVVDAVPQERGIVRTWRWGAGERGAVMLCNLDEDDAGVLAGAGAPDAEDAVINGGNDSLHEIGPLEVRRIGTADPPPAGWTATLEIRGGLEDKVRIFDGQGAAAAQLIGAAHAGGAAAASHVYPLLTGVPGSLPTQPLGIEAVRFAAADWDGIVQVRLTVRGTGTEQAFGVAAANLQYYTAAEYRVAPWMMPTHLDAAERVYVVDGGNHVDAAHPHLSEGNSAFRAGLTTALNLAPAVPLSLLGPAGIPPEKRDVWMQDCMELGYSVMPKLRGGIPRQRIEVVLRTHRDRTTRNIPRELLTADVGYLYPAVQAAEDAYDAAVLGGAGACPAYQRARNRLTAQIPDHATVDALGAADKLEFRARCARGAVQALINAGFGPTPYAAMVAGAIAEVGLHAPLAGLPAAEVAALAWAAASGADSEASEFIFTGFDAGGNLECTPPCRSAAGRVYPWGRIYYGTGAQMNAQTRSFLDAQLVQPPIDVPTDWLTVGHVDEVISFIPVPNGPEHKKWKMLIASPARAYEMLRACTDTWVMLRDRRLEMNRTWRLVQTEVRRMLEADYALEVREHATDTQIEADDLEEFNTDTVQPALDIIETRMKAETGATNDDIIRVPVIFMPAAGNGAEALTGDMVNMLVVNDRCIVPEPFGPGSGPAHDIFRNEMRSKIRAANAALRVEFVDDWYSYHARTGEVHCGTNTLRRPANLDAWLQTPAAEWWRYTP